MTDALHRALERSRDLGFLGPGPVEGHIAHATAFAAVVARPPARALDLGAGGGLPGLVLASRHWPGCRWTFLDGQKRRTAFLEDAVESTGLTDRVTVVTGRAEETARSPEHRGGYDLVVARSFGPPAVTAECAAPLLAPGGLLVVSEPPTGSVDRWPASVLAEELGLVVEGIDEVPGDPPTHLARLVRDESEIDRYPRRVGIPAKRPLF